ncbi:MAG: hypothetical protein ACE5JG_11435, partial [Planctomycetota bacterium]
DRDQLLYVAEAGARAAKRWFDAPVSGDPADPTAVRHAFLGRFDLRDPSPLDRAGRLVDADADPRTPPVPADGSAGRELYRQGRLVATGSPHLDLFHKPFRGDIVTSLLGTEQGPDILLRDRPGVVDLIDRINAALFTDQEATGRIQAIAIYAAPAAPAGAGFARLGVATIKVTAAKYRRLQRAGGIPVVPAGSRPLARATVRVGLAEIPAGAPRGPLRSCGDLTARGRLRARWGPVLAAGDVALAGRTDRLDITVASSFPYAGPDRHISGLAGGGDLAGWLADPDDSVEDPWLTILAGGRLVGWEDRPDQPFPYDPAAPIDQDHSNIFQRVPGVACSSFDYRLWKRIVRHGAAHDRHVHYFAFDRETGLFREQGRGPARGVRDWTHDREGIFFFDTADGRPPAAGNLTPPVTISGGDWSMAGLLYLNAVSFQAASVRGRARVLLPPGEPFDDADHDQLHNPDEPFVNLSYPTAADTGTAADEVRKDPLAAQSVEVVCPDGATYAVRTSTGRDAGGVPLQVKVNLFGVLFNAGDIVAEGDAVHYGSLVAGGDVVQVTDGADTPVIYFDERLGTGLWPPAEIAMPRTFVTFWQTSHP